jgi:transposase
MSLRKIGEELGLARNTVRKYFRQPPEPPLPTPRPLRASQLDPYEDYLLQRWSQGERNAAQLYREINARGYRGAATMVRAYIGHLRTTTADGSPPRSRKERTQGLSPRALRWLLTRKRQDLDQEEQTRLDQLLSLSLEVQTLYALLQAFLSMVRERKHQDLRSWMRQASTCGIPELGSFVTGIEQDYDAVHAALRLPWSQGITEGKVNKLKTLKRVMYGRAGFPLLRQRLLHDA